LAGSCLFTATRATRQHYNEDRPEQEALSAQSHPTKSNHRSSFNHSAIIKVPLGANTDHLKPAISRGRAFFGRRWAPVTSSDLHFPTVTPMAVADCGAAATEGLIAAQP
jgi:hypothetical protein